MQTLRSQLGSPDKCVIGVTAGKLESNGRADAGSPPVHSVSLGFCAALFDFGSTAALPMSLSIAHRSSRKIKKV